MKGSSAYVDIQRQRKLGLEKQQVADHLGCCWRTVRKYWDMTQEEYDLESEALLESLGVKLLGE